MVFWFLLYIFFIRKNLKFVFLNCKDFDLDFPMDKKILEEDDIMFATKKKKTQAHDPNVFNSKLASVL